MAPKVRERLRGLSGLTATLGSDIRASFQIMMTETAEQMNLLAERIAGVQGQRDVAVSRYDVQARCPKCMHTIVPYPLPKCMHNTVCYPRLHNTLVPGTRVNTARGSYG